MGGILSLDDWEIVAEEPFLWDIIVEQEKINDQLTERFPSDTILGYKEDFFY